MKVCGLLVTLLCAALGLACGASAQTASPGVPLKAGPYVLDSTRTHVGFALLRLGFAYYAGTFADPAGRLWLDPAKPSGTTLQVTTPISSLSTGTPAIDQDLKGPSWFDAARYPFAVFTSERVSPTGPDSADITGTLTLHGVSQVETLAVYYVSAGINPVTKCYEVGFEAATTIKRSTFGLTSFLPLIGDDVRLTIDAVFVAPR